MVATGANPWLGRKGVPSPARAAEYPEEGASPTMPQGRGRGIALLSPQGQRGVGALGHGLDHGGRVAGGDHGDSLLGSAVGLPLLGGELLLELAGQLVSPPMLLGPRGTAHPSWTIPLRRTYCIVLQTGRKGQNEQRILRTLWGLNGRRAVQVDDMPQAKLHPQTRAVLRRRDRPMDRPVLFRNRPRGGNPPAGVPG